MHIKDALGKGCKTDFAGFELDASKIEFVYRQFEIH